MIQQFHSWAYNPKKMKTNLKKYQYIYQMCIAALFIITKTWKQPKLSINNEWIKKMWGVRSCVYMPMYMCVHIQWNIILPLKG